jgi:serine/threonine protein kinase
MLETLGHYRIRRKIGQGAMGEVYEAWDQRLERPVAIKAISEASWSHAARQRLWREARALARVNHPRVCQIFDVFEKDEAVVLVLELLDGKPLADRLAAGSITTDEAVRIEGEILEALQGLHDHGIVHRDLKPSNVFLTTHGIKLLDFGLARATALPGGVADLTQQDATLTAPGSIVGTPLYMSPEQARGEVAGAASDIFSAGSIFYELLTGRRPFEDAHFVNVLYAILHHNPPPLSGSREIEALDRIIRRAMAKRVEDRYSSAQEMLQALKRISLTGDAGSALRARTVSRIVVLPFRTGKSDEETEFLAQTLPDAITSSLSAMDNLIVRSSLVASRFDGAPDPKRVATEADVDAFLYGSLFRAGDKLRVSCQLIEAPSGTVIWSESANSSMSDLFTVQDQVCDHILRSMQIPQEERERRVSKRDVPATPAAYECYLRGNRVVTARTADNMAIARGLYLQCIEESPGFAPAWAGLGRTYHFLNKFGEGTGDYAERSRQAFERAFAINPDLATAHQLSTPAECDQGRALDAMVRLLGRAQSRRNDPELFAGLVQACRYCDELDASIAAHHRGRYLDGQLLTGAEFTYFLLGDYAATLDCHTKRTGYYLDCAALAAMGEDRKALATLEERERAGHGTGLVKGIMRSLHAYLKGDAEECVNALTIALEGPRTDPEVLFYSARHLARVGRVELAVSMLRRAMDRGFLCGSAMARDPWFDSLRASPLFAGLMAEAEQRHRETHAAFLQAGGEEVIPVA